MTEDELLLGLIEALGFGGWTWTHIRRSDGVTVGHAGLPDIIAGHPDRQLAIAWELKTDTGRLTPDQWRWQLALAEIAGIDCRVIRPIDYDRALQVILFGKTPREAFGDGITAPSWDATTFVP